jgi:Lsr2
VATKTHVSLVDDLDGGEATETVQFSLRGIQYEIDLGEVNRKIFDDAFAVFIEHARKGPGVSRSHQRTRRSRRSDSDAAAARAWAATQPHLNGLLKERGRVPSAVVLEWVNAGSPRPSFTEPTLS